VGILLTGYLVFSLVRGLASAWTGTGPAPFAFLGGGASQATPEPGQAPTAVAAQQTGPAWNWVDRVYILLMGLDYRDWSEGEGPPRTDSMMLVTIDPITKAAGMLSIPRDLWVEIPGFEHNRINTAYFLGETYQLPGGGPAMAAKTVEQLLANLSAIPEAVRTARRNHGGGHANHTLIWTVMRPPREANAPAGKLAEALAAKFGSVEKFQELFSAAAAGQFGSGWAWLAAGPDGLEILATANQDSPISQGKTPLLGLDVWEHAYYLNYQNRRPDYIKAWWKVVNWDEVAKRFAVA